MRSPLFTLGLVLVLLIPSVAMGGLESELRKEINRLRASKGLPTLSSEGHLESLAGSWARQLASRDKVAHRPLVKSLLRRHGYMNENLYWTTAKPTAKLVVNAWIKSSGHRANLLSSRTRRMGLGIARSRSGKTYVVFNSAER